MVMVAAPVGGTNLRSRTDKRNIRNKRNDRKLQTTSAAHPRAAGRRYPCSSGNSHGTRPSGPGLHATTPLARYRRSASASLLPDQPEHPERLADAAERVGAEQLQHVGRAGAGVG